MYCNKCGKKLDDDAIFCPKCGDKIVNTDRIEEKTQNELDIKGVRLSTEESSKVKEEAYDVGTTKTSKKKIIISIMAVLVVLVIVVAIKLLTKPSVTTASLDDYIITVPGDYTYTSGHLSPFADLSFVGKSDREWIEIEMYYNDKGLAIENETVDSFIAGFPVTLEETGAGNFSNNGARAEGVITTGDFKGIAINYDATSNLRKTLLLANDDDLCMISLYGMNDPERVFDIIEVTR